MRRFRLLLPLLTVICLLVTMAPSAATAAPGPEWSFNGADLQVANITIDGKPADFTGYIINGRTVVPLRALFNALGITDIGWDQETFTVSVVKGSKALKLQVGNTQGLIDGKDYTLAVPPVLVNSRTYVPVRFVIDALGLDIKWDQATWTVIISTNTGCQLAPFQTHEGTIGAGGETWGKCGSPHVVKGNFLVEGADNPILTLEEGATVQFEADATLTVGQHAPGGLVVNGTAASPVLFQSTSTARQAGFWHGIRFYNQTISNDTRIAYAKIQDAGQHEHAAIYVEGWQKAVEIKLNNVTLDNSAHAGIRLAYQGRLAATSSDLTIIGTKQVNGDGGFPIITASYGSHNLPRGIYKDNEQNAVNIYEDGSGVADIKASTTWRNVSIPYAVSQDVHVGGEKAPTLTIEPGVITLWKDHTGLDAGGSNGPGYLVADATARPEGGGEWFTRPEGGGEWKVTKTELDLGLQLANSKTLEPGCALCGKNRAIVFGAWATDPEAGAWNGIKLMEKAGDKSKLVGTVIAYGGRDREWEGGLYIEADEGKTVTFTLAKSMIHGATRSGLELYGKAKMNPESTGNYFVKNGWPVRLEPENIGTLPAGQTFTENTVQAITVATNGSSAEVTATATWRNHGIPYQFELTVYIGSPAKPKVTIEPGTTLVFLKGNGLVVGSGTGTGSLEAKGQAGKSITFKGDRPTKTAWEGINITDNAGVSTLEMVVIENAQYGLQVGDDFGGFVKNTTFRNCETAIWRDYDLESGTSFATGLGNQFEGNGTDENE